MTPFLSTAQRRARPELGSASAVADYHQRVTYQPTSNFWALQWTETGIYLGLALSLGLLCVWWTRRCLT